MTPAFNVDWDITTKPKIISERRCIVFVLTEQIVQLSNNSEST